MASGIFVTAGLVSAAIGAQALFTPKETRYWWLSCGKGFYSGLAALYLVVNALVGLAAVLIATSLDWTPAHNEILRGLVYGFAAQAVIRVQVRGFGLDAAEATGSLLGGIVELTLAWLESLSQSRNEKRLWKLTPPQLAKFQQQLFGRFVTSDSNLSQTERDQVQSQWTALSTTVISAGGNAESARGELIGQLVAKMHEVRAAPGSDQ